MSVFTFLLAASLFSLPVVASAAGIPFFGPIIPKENPLCPAGWGMLIVVINNIILLLLTLAIVFVAPLMIAWAGFLLVVSQGDSGKRTEARKILTNTIVGIVIALAGWLIVDAIMAVLYNKAAPGLGNVAWSDIITSGGASQCLDQKGTKPGDVPAVSSTTPVTVVPGPGIRGASGLDISAAVARLRGSAAQNPPGQAKCWQFVRQAIYAGGLRQFTASGTAAKDAGPLLTAAGFTSLGSNNSSPQAGDVVIIQSYSGGSAAGHAAMYDGTKWISDFVQADFWGGPGYRQYKPAHEFYRP